MNDVTTQLVEQLLRTTVALAATATLVGLLLRLARVSSPVVHRAGCVLALLVGWSFLRMPVNVPWYEAEPTTPRQAAEILLPDLKDLELAASADELTVPTGWPRQLVVGVPQAPESSQSAATDVDLAAPADLAPVDSNISVPSEPSAADSVPPAQPVDVAGLDVQLEPDADGAHRAPYDAFTKNFGQLALAAWILGMAAIAFAWLIGYVRFVRRLPVGQAADGQWLDEWCELLAARGIGHAIPLRVTADAGPMLCRLPRGYELLVPAPLWRTLTPRQRASILRHELAHYQRGDVWKSLAAHLLALPHLFNPLAWWAVRRFDEAAEWACDHTATADEPATAYAKALLRLGEAAGRHPSYSPAARGRTLSRRIRRVLARSPQEDSLAKRVLFAIAALAIATAALVRVELVAQEPPAVIAPQAGAAPTDPPDTDAADKPIAAHKLSLHDPAEEPLPTGLLRLAAERTDTFHLTPDELAARGLRVAIAKPAALKQLTLRGSTAIDVNALARVVVPFAGRVEKLGEAVAEGNEKPRMPQFGDQVKKGQTLAILSCKELAEKKSELFDAISRMWLAEKSHGRVKVLAKGGEATDQEVREAEEKVQVAKIAATKAERTLRSWHVSEQEIKRVVAAAEHDPDVAKQEDSLDWGRFEIVAPIAGTIVQKNVSAGDVVDASAELFKIADLSRLSVWAHVSEEDIPLLERLPPDKRTWQIRAGANPAAEPMEGSFAAVDGVVDPNQHMALVLGTVLNTDGRLKAGQFVMAAIDIPADPPLVDLPSAAVVHDGTSAAVFVRSAGQETEFKRSRIVIAKRANGSVLVCSEPTPAERDAGREGVKAGEKLLAAAAADEPIKQPTAPGNATGNPPEPAKSAIIDGAAEQTEQITRAASAVAKDGKAVGYIRVVRNPAPSASGVDDRHEYRIVRNTTVEMLRSKSLLSRVIRHQAIAELPLVQMQPDPIQWLHDSLVLSYPNDGELLMIELAAADTAQATKIVNDVIDTYFKEVIDKGVQERAKKAQKLKAAYDEKSTALERERRQLRTLEQFTNALRAQLEQLELESQAPERIQRVDAADADAASPKPAIRDKPGKDQQAQPAPQPAPAAGAADNRSRQPEAAKAGERESLRYDGQSFDQWVVVLQTDLSPERKAEAMRALAAFAPHGYAPEAIAQILRGVREHDAPRDAAARALHDLGLRSAEMIAELEKAVNQDSPTESNVLVNEVLKSIREPQPAPATAPPAPAIRETAPTAATNELARKEQRLRLKLAELSEQLIREKKEADQLQKNLGIVDVAAAAQQTALIQSQLTTINNSIFASTAEISNLEVKIDEYQLDIELAQDPAAKEARAEEEIRKDEKTKDLVKELSNVELAIADFSKQTKEKDDPALKRLEKRRSAVEDRISARRSELLKKFSDANEAVKVKEFQGKLAGAVKHRDSVRERVEELKKQRDELITKLQIVTRDTAELDTKKQYLRVLQQFVDELNMRLFRTQVEMVESGADVRLPVDAAPPAKAPAPGSGAAVPKESQPAQAAAAVDAQKREQNLRRLVEQQSEALIREAKAVDVLRKSLGVCDDAEGARLLEILQNGLAQGGEYISALEAQVRAADAEIDKCKIAIELLGDQQATQARTDEAIDKDDQLQRLRADLAATEAALDKAKEKEGEKQGEISATSENLARRAKSIADEMTARRVAILELRADEDALAARRLRGKLELTAKHRIRLAEQLAELRADAETTAKRRQLLHSGLPHLKEGQQRLAAQRKVLDGLNAQLAALVRKKQAKDEAARGVDSQYWQRREEKLEAALAEMAERLGRERTNVESLEKELGVADEADAGKQVELLRTRLADATGSIFAHKAELANLEMKIDEYALDIALAQDPAAKKARVEEGTKKEIEQDEKLRALEKELGNVQLAVADQVKGKDNRTIKRLEQRQTAVKERIALRRDELLNKFSDANQAVRVNEYQGRLAATQKHRDAISGQLQDLLGQRDALSAKLETTERSAGELETKRQNLLATQRYVDNLNAELKRALQEKEKEESGNYQGPDKTDQTQRAQ